MNFRMIQIGSAVAATAMLAGASPTMAKGGGDRVTRSGVCSAGSHWKLKAKPDNGKIETEFEVDQNRNAVNWNVTIKRDGRTAFSGSRTTKAPSGSFSVSRLVANGAGKDKITAVAKRPGETCSGSLTI